MKKIVSALLACLMVFGLVACSNGTKNVEMPDVKLELKDVEFTAHGNTMNDTVVVSPMNADAFKPDATFETLKKMSFLKNWEAKTQYSETGTPFFANAGQLTSFKYGTTLHFYEPDGDSYGKSVTVYYNSETDSVVGYSVVAVEFTTDAAEKTLTQDQMFDVLKAVYGEEYANYLFYAKMTESDGFASSEIKDGNATLTFERTYDKTMGSSYAMRVTNNDTKQVNGNPGDFKPSLESLAILRDVLNMKENDSVLDLKNMGTEFLSKHFGEGAHFEVSTGYINSMTGAYLYNEMDGYDTLMMRYAIAQDGVAAENRLNVTMSTSINSKFEESYVMFELGTLTKENLNDEAREVFRQQALAMVKDILGVEDIQDAFAEDKYFESNVNGKDVLIIFRINWSTNDDGSETVTLSLATTTNLNFFAEQE